MTKKIDVYTKIHKAQRQHFFALSTKAGRMDFTDAAKVSHLKLEISAMIKHLRNHAQHEEQFIHPVLSEFCDQGNILHHEHEMLELSLDKLEQTIAADNNIEIYPALNRFIAVYLQHIDEEEKAQVEILWKQCSDEKLMKIMENFQNSLTPQEMKDNLDFMLPCLNVEEIKEILSGIKKNAPPYFFEDLLKGLQNSLSPSEKNKIQEFLNV